MSGEFTPAGFFSGFWRWFGAGVFTLAVIAALIWVTSHGEWWWENANANHQAHIIRNGYSNQQSLREQVTQQIANVDDITVSIAQSAGNATEVQALEGQRENVAGIVCQDAGEVTGDPLPANQRTWVRSNCQAGVVRPGSKYASNGGN